MQQLVKGTATNDATQANNLARMARQKRAARGCADSKSRLNSDVLRLQRKSRRGDRTVVDHRQPALTADVARSVTVRGEHSKHQRSAVLDVRTQRRIDWHLLRRTPHTAGHATTAAILRRTTASRMCRPRSALARTGTPSASRHRNGCHGRAHSQHDDNQCSDWLGTDWHCYRLCVHRHRRFASSLNCTTLRLRRQQRFAANPDRCVLSRSGVSQIR